MIKNNRIRIAFLLACALCVCGVISSYAKAGVKIIRSGKISSELKENAKPRWGALLIGCVNFPIVSGVESLPSTAADVARARDEWLSQRAANDDIVELVDNEDGQDESSRPTRANILQAIDEAVERTRANPDGVLIIMIGTHGLRIGARSFLVATDVHGLDEDFNEEDPDAVTKFAEEHGLISVNEILDRLEQGRGRRVLLIDACRSDASGKGVTEPGDFFSEYQSRFPNEKLRESNLAIITSCTPNEEAQGLRYEKGGAFTSYFLDGITSGAADFTGGRDGKITLQEAYNYASIKTRRYAEATEKDASKPQTPQYFGDETLQLQIGTAPEFEPYREKAPALVATRESKPYSEEEAKETKWEDVIASVSTSDVEIVKCVSDSLIRDGHYRLAEEALDFAIANEPSSPRALNARGFARRAQGDYAGALEDFNRAGSELTLYVQANEVRATSAAPDILQGALIYPERGVALGVTTCCRDAKDAPIRMVEGEQVVVDRIQGGWARLARYLDRPIPESELPWVPLASLNWTRELAETAVATNQRTTNLPGTLRAIQQGTNFGRVGGGLGATPSLTDE